MLVSTRAWNRGKSANTFFNVPQKNTKLMVEKGSLNRLLPLVNFINCDPLSDHSKSKAQTTKVQQPRPCLLIPFAKLNYFAKEKEKEENICFSSLPDGKSASRKNYIFVIPQAIYSFNDLLSFLKHFEDIFTDLLDKNSHNSH